MRLLPRVVAGEARADPGDPAHRSGYLPGAGRMDTPTSEAVLEKAELARCTYP